MLTVSRTMNLQQDSRTTWARLVELPSMAQRLGCIVDAHSPDHVIGRIDGRFLSFRVSGSFRLDVVDRIEPSFLRLRGHVLLPAGPPVHFEVLWQLEACDATMTRVVYIAKVRSSPALERIGRMTLARKGESIDRKVVAALHVGRSERSAA